MSKNSLKIPKHIAIVMDGNGRWAKRRLMPRTFGHKVGVKRVKELVKACGKMGVDTLSLFAFSSENWKRPKEEVSFLMKLFLDNLKSEMKELHENNVQLKIIGDTSVLNSKIQEEIKKSQALMEDNTGLKLRVAINYGGTWDIVQAVKHVAQEVKKDIVAPNDIDAELFEKYLTTNDVSPVDLFIRTSGEIRISNFFLWQIAYAELYFPKVHFPGFNEKELDKAIEYFNKRERRFGKISEQL